MIQMGNNGVPSSPYRIQICSICDGNWPNLVVTFLLKTTLETGSRNLNLVLESMLETGEEDFTIGMIRERIVVNLEILCHFVLS